MNYHPLCLTALTLAVLSLGACATDSARVDPAVIVQEAKVPVRAPCDPKVGPDPVYSDNDAAIAAAPNIFERAKLYRAGRSERIGREAELKAGLAGCAQ